MEKKRGDLLKANGGMGYRLSPGSFPRFKIHKPSFVSAQQGDSGEEIQSKYVDCGKKKLEKKNGTIVLLWLVAECRILLTFGIWQGVRLADGQGLAPVV